MAANGIFGDLVVVAHRAGVREPVHPGADGAHDRAQRAEPPGLDRAVEAQLAELAVLVEAAITRQRMIEEDDLAAHLVAEPAQGLERVDLDELGLEPGGRRADAAPERERAQRPRKGRDEGDAIIDPARPALDGDRLGVHVLEARGLHLRHGPDDRPLRRGRAREPRPDLVREAHRALVRPPLLRGAAQDARRVDLARRLPEPEPQPQPQPDASRRAKTTRPHDPALSATSSSLSKCSYGCSSHSRSTRAMTEAWNPSMKR